MLTLFVWESKKYLRKLKTKKQPKFYGLPLKVDWSTTQVQNSWFEKVNG